MSTLLDIVTAPIGAFRASANKVNKAEVLKTKVVLLLLWHAATYWQQHHELLLYVFQQQAALSDADLSKHAALRKAHIAAWRFNVLYSAFMSVCNRLHVDGEAELSTTPAGELLMLTRTAAQNGAMSEDLARAAWCAEGGPNAEPPTVEGTVAELEALLKS